MRHGPWKLIPGQGGGGVGWKPGRVNSDEPAGQLYNLAENPGETDNLYEQRPDVVRRLEALLTETLGESLPPE